MYYYLPVRIEFISIEIILHSLDSIRELRKHALVEIQDLKTPQAEAHAHMKQFRSQRNFYIAGFALFLWLYVKENFFTLDKNINARYF